jgi:hypothetical protein
MEEIRFRAYHQDQKEWWYFTLDEVMSGENKNEIQRNNSRLSYTTQHTGYSDSKRIRIYDGDVLACSDGKCVVKFEDGAFCFVNRVNWLDEWNWADDSNRFKVVGNIFNV